MSNMTWEDFKKKVNDVLGYSRDIDEYRVDWVTGGLTGGNCWGDNADSPISADPEPEMHGIDDILSEVCPNISFLTYKKLMQEIVKTGEDTSYEYYGNYTHYAYKTVNIRDLYDELVKGNYI